MKRIFIIAIVLLSSIATLSAQQQQGQGQHRRGSQGDFLNFQMKMIEKQLEIDEAIQEEFEQIYSEYNTKLKEFQPKRPDREGGQNKRPTNEEIEEKILESFEMAEKTTNLKKEYYTKFKEILTPHQIFRMYSIERQIGDRLNSEVQNRANGGNRPHQQPRDNQ